MAESRDESVSYTARDEYLAEHVVRNYMADRFTGFLGRYRFRREQATVTHLIGLLPSASIDRILDCPTGTGRWLPLLGGLHPRRIVAIDVSPTMLAQAKMVNPIGVEIEFREGIAEQIPFEDRSFDLVFCHALFKHLPELVQLQVLKELSRVTSEFLIVAASVRRGPSGVIRRIRKLDGAYSISRKQFEQAAHDFGLRLVASRKATTPLGSEYSYLFRKAV